MNDTGGGAGDVDLNLSPTLFRKGDNLFAIHGIDTNRPFSDVSVKLTIVVPEPAFPPWRRNGPSLPAATPIEAEALTAINFHRRLLS